MRSAPPTLSRLAGTVRTFMPPVWRTWHEERGGERPAVASAGTCGRTSLLLAAILREQGFPAEWRSGAGADATGFFDGDGWRSHAWVECGGWIVDITADQFGAPPVIVCLSSDDRYRTGRDLAAPEWRLRRREAAEAALFLWRKTAGADPS